MPSQMVYPANRFELFRCCCSYLSLLTYLVQGVYLAGLAFSFSVPDSLRFRSRRADDSIKARSYLVTQALVSMACYSPTPIRELPI